MFLLRARELTAAGQLVEANDLLRDAVVAAQQLGDRRAEGLILGQLGQVLLAREMFAEATNAFQPAYHIFVELDDRSGAATALLGLARSAKGSGERAAAADFARQAVAIARSMGDPLRLASALEELGADESNLKAERAAWTEVRDLYRQVGNPKSEMAALFHLAELCRQRAMSASLSHEAGDIREAVDEATSYLLQAGNIAVRIGDPSAEARIAAINKGLFERRASADIAGAIGPNLG